jgi:uncharacterized membrane protein
VPNTPPKWCKQTSTNLHETFLQQNQEVRVIWEVYRWQHRGPLKLFSGPKMDALQLERDLNDFREVETKYTDGLQTLLKNYAALLLDHQRLKSDYEEARDSREKYKKIVKETVRVLRFSA